MRERLRSVTTRLAYDDGGGDERYGGDAYDGGGGYGTGAARQGCGDGGNDDANEGGGGHKGGAGGVGREGRQRSPAAASPPYDGIGGRGGLNAGR